MQLHQLEDRCTPATLTVNSILDSVAPDANLTLREAINAVNAQSPAGFSATEIAQVTGTFGSSDTIQFASSLGGSTIQLVADAEIAIDRTLKINGPAARVTIDALGKSRIFNTDLGNPTDVVTINNLALTGGSTFNGGAIFIGDETVNVNDRRLAGNNVSGHGGAITIQTAGTLHLTRSTVSGNTALGNGGGVYFFSGGSATIVDSAIVNNQAVGDGGGFYFFGTVSAGGLTLRNTTISDNFSGKSGAGIVLPSFGGTALIQNCTIFSNSANGPGGGIAQTGGSSIVDLQSSIVSDNGGSITVQDIVSTTPVNASFSDIGSTASFTFGTNTNNLIGQTLLLGPLQNNGGPTFTFLPAAASPVKNKGSNPASLPFDARGSGFPRSAHGGVDIGAVEVPANMPPTISDVADQLGKLNSTLGPIAFSIGDTETAATALTVTGKSSNQNIVPDSLITFGGSGANRTVSFPTSPVAGTTTITLTVTDTDGGSATDTFVVTLPANTPPTISNVGNQTGKTSSTIAAIAFTVGDKETAATALTVSAKSSTPPW